MKLKYRTVTGAESCVSLVPIGETHYFDLKLFRNCADTNIQLLVKLIGKVEETYRTIKNVNAIETKEDGEEE